jgi:hypothetical protein
VKQIMISAAVAAVVCGFAFWLDDRFDDEVDVAEAGADSGAAVPGAGQPASAGGNAASIPAAQAAARPALSITDALIEDTWVNGARQPGSDRRTLTSAADSVCYLTKVEISGVQGPEDSSSCSIEVDDFTGFWELVATSDEGSRSEIRCNARCFSVIVEGGSL